jgi:aspartyl-tRNA(Asn)/glutamyl-tRNA(Gln) amidotransferase subunit B
MGHMRFEPNINVHITDDAGQVHKTAITEIKNLNSFSVLERATAYEVRRQIDQWEQTGSLGRKSTYGWDESTQTTFHQRDKEDAHDYRYFPDPDLAPVEVGEEWLTELKARVGELPAARRRRYAEALGLSQQDAAALAAERHTGDLFEEALRFGGSPKRMANLILSHGRRISNERNIPLHRTGIDPQFFAGVGRLIDENKIAASAAGAIFDAKALTPEAYSVGESTLYADTAGHATLKFSVTGISGQAKSGPASATGELTVEKFAEGLGLLQVSDTGAIDAAVDALIAQNPKSLQDVRAGKMAALGSLVGMIVKSNKGLNPRLVQERLRAKLGL